MTSTFKDILEESKNQAKDEQHNEIMNEVLNQINFLTETLRGAYGKNFKDFNEDELTRVQGELAVYRSSLSDFVADAKMLVSISENQEDLREASLRPIIRESLLKKHDKVTNKDIEVESKKQLIRINLIKGFHEAHLEKLKNQWFGVQTQIIALAHRITYLRGDSSTSKYYGDGNLTNPGSHQ